MFSPTIHLKNKRELRMASITNASELSQDISTVTNDERKHFIGESTESEESCVATLLPLAFIFPTELRGTGVHVC